MAKPPFLRVNLRSPYQNYFSGSATSVTAINRLGPFDILPNHTPFFSLLVSGVVTVQTASERLEFKIQNGIIRTKNNQVDVFLNI